MIRREGQTMYEGTWDEIAAHADEMRKYGRLRLVVVSETVEAPIQEKAGEQNLADALSELLEEAKHIQKEAPVPLTDPYEIAFDEAVAEKYRKMGFKL